MAVPRLVTSLGKAAVVAALVVPATAVWLSGRLGEETGEPPPAAPAPLATLPRSEPAATAVTRLPPSPDQVPSAAPPVSVGTGSITVPPPVDGAAAVPTPRAGQVVGEPHGLPDPNRSEAIPR